MKHPVYFKVICSLLSVWDPPRSTSGRQELARAKILDDVEGEKNYIVVWHGPRREAIPCQPS